MYLWDQVRYHFIYIQNPILIFLIQFRLYAGLLGTTPLWTRTDLPQPEEVNDEDENEVEGGPTSSTLPRRKRGPNLDAEMDPASDFDDDDNEEFIANISQTSRSNESRPPQPPWKRFPNRAPYELYNKDPIPVSSEAEVHALLAQAAVEKETKLLAFLGDPEKSVKIFLSSYMRKEGFIWYVLSFFLFLIIKLTPNILLSGRPPSCLTSLFFSPFSSPSLSALAYYQSVNDNSNEHWKYLEKQSLNFHVRVGYVAYYPMLWGKVPKDVGVLNGKTSGTLD